MSSWFLNLRPFIATLLFIVALGVVPALIIITGLLLGLRYLLNVYIKYFKPDLVSLVPGGSGYFSMDDPFDNPDLIVGAHLILEGDIQIEDFVNSIDKCLEESPFYDQLNVTLGTWIGFPVWKRTSKFLAREHVKSLDPKSLLSDTNSEINYVTVTDIVQYTHSSTKIPFPKDTVPFDLTLFREVYLDGAPKSSTVVIIRIHHSMADALSLFRLFSFVFDNGEILREEMDQRFRQHLGHKKRSVFERLMSAILFPFLGLHELIFHLVHSFDINCWHGFTSPRRTEFNFASTILAKRDINTVRSIHGNVSFLSVVLGALTAATRRYLLKNGLPVPENVHFACSLPIAPDMNRLGNSITLVCVTLPTGLSDGGDILKRIHKEFVGLKNTRIPYLIRAGFLFLGLFPRKLIKILNRWRVSTGGTSSVVGPSTSMFLMNNKITHICGTAYIPSSTGVYMWCTGYDGMAHICLGVSSDIMSEREMVQEYAEYLNEEVAALMETEEGIKNTRALVLETHGKIE